MSNRRRYRGSKDANHDKIGDDFRMLGCTVADLHDSGLKDWPDFVVGCMGLNHIVEVKNPDTDYGRAGLSPGQARFAQGWRGGPVHVVWTSSDVIALVNSWRKR